MTTSLLSLDQSYSKLQNRFVTASVDVLSHGMTLIFRGLPSVLQEQYLNSRYQREKKPPPQQLALSRILRTDLVWSFGKLLWQCQCFHRASMTLSQPEAFPLVVNSKGQLGFVWRFNCLLHGAWQVPEMHNCPQKMETDRRNELRIHTTSCLMASEIRWINDTMITVPKTKAASHGCMLSQGPAMKKLGARSPVERTLHKIR